MQNGIREITNRDRPKFKKHSQATGYEGVYWTALTHWLGLRIKPSGLINWKGGDSFKNGITVTFSRTQFHGLSYTGPCYVKL
jgi:hypothetical protein